MMVRLGLTRRYIAATETVGISLTRFVLVARLLHQTVATLQTFFLAMAVYPEVQRTAQGELDKVVGRDRLPELADQEHLPYVRAMCTELLRWLPIAPIGETSDFDSYHGPENSQL